MPLQQTSGNVTADAYGGGVAAIPQYIENFFSTWLRTGTGASATVTTGLDASTNKALVWTKSRSAATDHKLTDTVRGVTKAIVSNTRDAQTTDTQGLTAFSSTGYTIGTDTNYNNSGATYVDWEFAATPKFFDVVTFTAGSSANRRISHSLASVPGFYVIKALNNTDSWYCYTSTTGISNYLRLNSTDAVSAFTNVWGTSGPTTTDFGVNEAALCYSGQPYVAYLFASNAGGFGLTGTDNVISCGSYTGVASGTLSINLGYEAQWVLIKKTTANNGSSRNWYILDTMRGMPVLPSYANGLFPNLNDAESVNNEGVHPSATGFNLDGGFDGVCNSGETYIYIAIRRGPMKVPTDATKVFKPVTYTGSPGNQSITGVGFPPDLFMANWRASVKGNFEDRLRGTDPYLQSTTTGAEATGSTNIVSYDMSGITLGVNNLNNKDGASFIGYFYQRAPSFFDEVCYTGTGSATTFNHNLGAVPELMIVRTRGASGNWTVYVSSLGNNYRLILNDTGAAAGPNATFWNNTTPTASVFTVGTSYDVNYPSVTQVAYLFASAPGVSKIGTYTGNGTTQTINCGFTAGARFVLIKRTNAAGDWYVYDTARGMTVLTDPYLLLNSAAAEVATLGSVTTVSTGFALNSTILADINVSGGSFVFLAIA